jgi:hypothetical protein
MTSEINEALSRTLLLSRDFVPNEVSDDTVVRALRATRVALFVDAANVSCGACQSSVVTLAQLLVATGISVRFVGPDVRLTQAQPPWTSRTLYGVLEAMRQETLPGARVSIGGRPARRELSFAFGDSRVSCEVGWRLSGSAWAGAIGPLAIPAPRWQSDFPIGGLVAATLAAGEPFKAAVRALYLPTDVETAQLRPVVEASVRLAPETTPVAGDVGRVDFVSGGAIAQATLHALLRVQGLRGDVRVYEPELLDLSNLNRYALALRSSVGRLKLDSLRECASPNFRLGGLPLRFDATLADATTLAPMVLVGTDNLPSRWLVQGRWPTWLCVGATSHFEAMVSEHEVALDSGCAGCAHPHDDGVVATIPTVAFVSYWSGLMMAARLLRRLAGARCDLGEQAVSLFTLRLDNRHGQWRRPVPFAQDCPVARHRLVA